MSCISFARRHRLNMALAALLCAVLFTTGCWGLILNGRPASERNRGDVDAATIILDLLVTPFCVGIIIDACAGTIRKPTEEQKRKKGVSSVPAEHLEKYKKLGYRETNDPLKLPKTLKLNVRPADVAKCGDKQMKVVWKGTDGPALELFSGTVREANGREVALKGASGAGHLEVYLDGQCQMAWDARAAGLRVQMAKQ